MQPSKRKRDREVLMMRVGKGILTPADSYTTQRLRAKAFHTGDLVGVELRKIRNPAFHRLAHALGSLLVENTDRFLGLNAHQALKRIQYEAGVGCDEMSVQAGDEMAVVRIPRSLSFASMDDGEFHEIYSQMCGYIARTYFPKLTQEQVAQMAELMTAEAA